MGSWAPSRSAIVDWPCVTSFYKCGDENRWDLSFIPSTALFDRVTSLRCLDDFYVAMEQIPGVGPNQVDEVALHEEILEDPGWIRLHNGDTVEAVADYLQMLVQNRS